MSDETLLYTKHPDGTCELVGSVGPQGELTVYITGGDGKTQCPVEDEDKTKGGQVKPNNQPKPGPIGNTQGIVVPQTAPNASGENNPAPQPQPEKETKGWWARWGSDVTHGVLDVIGLIPVAGEIADGVNAIIYTAEGDLISAGLSVAAMWPAGGQAATAAKIGRRAAKEIAEEATERAAKEAAEKAAKELEEAAAKRIAKEAEEKAAKEAEEAAAKKANGGKGEKKDGGKVKGGPCDHLRQGSGKGPYRGGAHSKTSKPTNDGKDSHHMPADDTTPLKKKDGPAIQMDPKDHAKTSSNGQMPGSVEYREMIEELINNGKWREAMAKEIEDIRRVAREAGDSKKYNEAMLEMLEYYKCLEKNNLLK